MSVLIRIRKVGLLFGVVLLTACGGGGGESSSDNERVDAYSASPNFNYQLTQEVQSNTSERWQAYYALQIESALNPLNKLDGLVPNTITVTYAVCGLSSLFYSSNDQSITVCDEFIDDAIEFAAEYGGVYYHDLVTYIVVFGLYQEIAKALVDIHGIPVTVSGGVESTANSIASVMVGETGRSLSALFGGWFLLEQSSSSYGVSIDDEELIVDIICLAFGSDSNFSYRPDLQETFEPLIEEGRDCVNEYEVERNGLYSSIPVLSELNNTDEVVPSLIAVSDESPPKFNNEPLLPLLVNGQDFWVCVSFYSNSLVAYSFDANGSGAYLIVNQDNEIPPDEFTYHQLTNASAVLSYSEIDVVEVLSDIAFSGDNNQFTSTSSTDDEIACEKIDYYDGDGYRLTATLSFAKNSVKSSID